MVATPQRPELIAIVGPTASGKSDLALRVAKEFDGEIIAADSRTVYKDMDVGTAKPSPADQKRIKHWGLDLVEPGERFSAHQFQEYSEQVIADIQKRGKLPILVGGTGLYIDAILYGFEFGRDADPDERKELGKLSVEMLQAIILKNGYKMPVNLKNRRHLIRIIETKGHKAAKHSKPSKNTLITGLMPPDDVLRSRINQRAEQVFDRGVIEETRKILSIYGEQKVMSTAGIVYKICLRLINQEISQKEAVSLFKKADWQYARRQRTWFRRNKFIQWFPDSQSAYEHIESVLNK